MRKLIVAVAFASAAGPAAGQAVSVGAKQTVRDTATVRLIVGDVSPEQLRGVFAKLNASIALNGKLEAQLVDGVKASTMSREQQAALQDEMERVFVQVLSLQHQLVLGCSMQRPRGDMVNGTLGLHVHDSVPIFRTFGDMGGGTLTMFFKSTPVVAAVDPGSPAERAGIRVGDAWVAANNRTLIDSVRFDELLKPGSVVIARIVRDGKEVPVGPMKVVKKVSDIPVGLCDSVKQFDFPTPFMSAPGSGFVTMQPKKPVERVVLPGSSSGSTGGAQVFLFRTSTVVFGASLQPLDDEWRKNFAVQGDGVGIIEVMDGSQAQSAGLRKFDVVTHINGVAIGSPAAFLKLASSERRLILTVVNKAVGVHTVTLSRP